MNIATFVFAQQNSRQAHPMEDVYASGVEGRSFAVADGVTRDCYSVKDVGGSGSAKAAKMFCERVLAFTNVSECGSDGLEEGFNRANERIGELNRKCEQGLDYGDHDYFGAVGAAAYICDNQHMHFGYVGDCRIIVLGAGGEKKLETPDDVAPARAYLAYLKSKEIDSVRERSRLIRARARNNYGFQDELGQHPGYGVFTGESGVKPFYRFGSLDLSTNDLILLLTDGFVPLLELPEFLHLISAYPESYREQELQIRLTSLCDTLAVRQPEKYGDDKTLILVRYNP